MAIFNSYVKLPEGMSDSLCHTAHLVQTFDWLAELKVHPLSSPKKYRENPWKSIVFTSMSVFVTTIYLMYYTASLRDEKIMVKSIWKSYFSGKIMVKSMEINGSICSLDAQIKVFKVRRQFVLRHIMPTQKMRRNQDLRSLATVPDSAKDR